MEEPHRSEHGEVVGGLVRGIALLLLCMASASAADARCTPSAEFLPSLCPLVQPKVKAVIFEKNGAKSALATDPSIDCSGFRLTPNLVRRYLATARAVAPDTPPHVLDWSPCYAAGTVYFVDGRSARFSIDQLGTAAITIESEAERTLACPGCRFGPFVQ
jgi:hypothetical protein